MSPNCVRLCVRRIQNERSCAKGQKGESSPDSPFWVSFWKKAKVRQIRLFGFHSGKQAKYDMTQLCSRQGVEKYLLINCRLRPRGQPDCTHLDTGNFISHQVHLASVASSLWSVHEFRLHFIQCNIVPTIWPRYAENTQDFRRVITILHLFNFDAEFNQNQQKLTKIPMDLRRPVSGS